MRNIALLLVFMILTGCEEQFSIRISEDLLYDCEWKMWEKTIQSENTKTGEITNIKSSDIYYRIIFNEDSIQIATKEDASFRAFSTQHISLDSIVYTDPLYNVTFSYKVLRFFGRKKTAYDENDSLLLPFYTYLKLENKKKNFGEDQILTEFLLLYRE